MFPAVLQIHVIVQNFIQLIFNIVGLPQCSEVQKVCVAIIVRILALDPALINI